MKKTFLLTAILFQIFTISIFAQKKTYYTNRITTKPPVIDGVLNDDEWGENNWENNFIQFEPYEGKKPSEKTEFKILYDDDNLYVAIKALDSVPEKIEYRMSRRDDPEGDFVAIMIDSYFDHLTSFNFIVNAAGVKTDIIMSNNGDNEDDTWNPVWFVKTSKDKKGWYAEMKIPFTQIRFNKNGDQTWGLQVGRQLFRKDELSLWQHIPQNSPGFIHLFGELKGIKNIKPKRQIEILPYTRVKVEKFKKEEGNPFATGKSHDFAAGIDGKVGITNDFTLDFTINPDFGQVEADPSEVNLTTFESFFAEKRPFFIEGKNIMDYQLTPGDGGFSNDNLFYSRRIGRSPHYYPDLNDNEYADMPENTTILGAFKLTGKTKKGLSVAVLESVTSKEEAEIDHLGERRKETVEPFTNYFLGRVQKDYDKGNTIIGGMFTATNRKILSDNLNFLPTSAYTGGIDFSHSWKKKTYTLMAKANFSHITGTKEAMLEAQESPLRYFQRPDASYVSIDSNRTSLTGHSGILGLIKSGSGHFKYAAWVTWRSPGFEANDMGYLRMADKIFQVFWCQYRIWAPFSIFRNISMNFNQWSGWNFGAQNIFKGGNINFNTQFKNYWHFNTGINYDGESISEYELRGGPALKTPGSLNNWFSIHTDSRKKISFNFGGFNSWSQKNYSRNHRYWVGLEYIPINAFKLSLQPAISKNNTELQYVDTYNTDNGKKYVFASLAQKTFSMSIRLNYYVTPDLSIQYYGQPFISAVNYTDFKYITNSMADEYNDRFHNYTDNDITYNSEDEIYSVDENHDNITDFTIENPNFNFLQFRSNLVARWEYLPGSTIYLVWSQGRTDYNSDGMFVFDNNMNDLFDVRPHNVFLIKLSYRIKV